MNDERRLSQPPPPRVNNLATLSGVRKELVSIYRAGRRRELDTADMSRLAFVLVQIAKVIEQSDLEARMAALEAALRAPDTRSRYTPTPNGVAHGKPDAPS
jgi:hypothetical protein